MRRHPALFVFVARAPEPGATKTRLGATIGMTAAADLYRAFLRDLAARFTPAAGADPGYDFGWAHTPAEVDFRQILIDLGCAPPPSVRFVPQCGAGLAARLDNVFHWAAAEGYERAVIAASDSPQLPRSAAAAAVAALADHELVLGRTFDGGYYLIGVRGTPDVLAGAPMSTGREADALVARAACLGLRTAELPATFDVDVAADLALLAAALAPNGCAAPATWDALRRLRPSWPQDESRVSAAPAGGDKIPLPDI
ncbi:MAG TPA: DUF2064 domain-containing protein [Thermomicrobiales bacterium]|nr:DUF2064 domain-containing protein [Thermomicrobiales bacterium]